MGLFYVAPGLESLHEELWRKHAGFSGIQDFTIEVPQPQFYLEPGYRSRMEQAGIRDFPLLHNTHKTKVGVFKKLKTTNELPCGSSSLLIRSEHESIEDTLVEAVSSKWAGVNPGEDPKKGEHHDYTVSGQPGSGECTGLHWWLVFLVLVSNLCQGKTWFLSYILVRRLLVGRPTVYRKNDGKCYLFSEWSKGREVNLEFLSTFSDSEKRELWILSDEALVDPEWNWSNPWFVVLAASPQKVQASRQWEKDRNCGTHYMRNWEWDEIFAAFRYHLGTPSTRTHMLTNVSVGSLENPKVGLGEINTLYTTFTCLGPIARTCLEMIPARSSNEKYHGCLEGYLAMVDREIQYFAGIGGLILQRTISSYSSHRVAIMYPYDGGGSYKHLVATRWIAHRMAATTGEEPRQYFYQFFEDLSSQPQLCSPADWFFEAYAHEWFRKGGEFEADELPVDGTNLSSQMKFSTKTQADISYFTDARNLAKQVQLKGLRNQEAHASQIGKHFQPLAKNHESFDAVVFNRVGEVILLRYSMADRRYIEPGGVKTFLRSMPITIKTVHFVYVVSEGHCAEKSSDAQEIPDFASLGCGREVKQWRLVFADADIKKMVLGDGVETNRWKRIRSWRAGAKNSSHSAPEESAREKRARR